MIWLTWRQFRTQIVSAAIALGALAIYLVWLGMHLRDRYDTAIDCATCSASSGRNVIQNEFETFVILTGFAVVAIPALIGAFWGAPLVAREFEAGTHRFVWSQSVTRTRWLAVKLAVVTVSAVVVAGLFSALFTWATKPYSDLFDDRFTSLAFPTRGLVPVAYAVFAVVVGMVLGLVLRRSLPAMALTLAAFVALQILVPNLVRPHLMTPLTKTVDFRKIADEEGSTGMNIGPGGINLEQYNMPDAWALSTGKVVHADDGTAPTRGEIRSCIKGEWRKDIECLGDLDLRFSVTYHPGSRYWTFQWLESVGYLALAGLLTGAAFWRIRRGA